MEDQLNDAAPITADPNLLAELLDDHKSLNDDVANHSARLRDVTAATKKVSTTPFNRISDNRILL